MIPRLKIFKRQAFFFLLISVNRKTKKLRKTVFCIAKHRKMKPIILLDVIFCNQYHKRIKLYEILNIFLSSDLYQSNI